MKHRSRWRQQMQLVHVYASLQQPSGPAVQVNSPAADAATAAGDYDGYEIPIPTYVHVAPPLPRDNAYETII